MRRIALLVAASGLVGWGLAGALGGCGGDDAVVPAADGATGGGDDDGSSGNTSSSGTSGTPTDDSGKPTDDGGTPTDASDDGSSSGSSGNVTSNPNKITCGPVECDAGGFGQNNANRCCVRDGGANPVCSTANACGNNDLELACDEPADCPSFGNVRQRCCLRLGGNGGQGDNDPRSECSAQQCGQNGGTQLCKTNADCGDGGVCNPKKCGNYNVRVCGSPAGCQ